MSDDDRRDEREREASPKVAFDDELLDALSEGSLPSSTRGLMGVLAHGDESLEIELEAHRPLGAGFESRMAQQLVFQAKRVRHRRRLATWTGAGATVLAAAAAWMLIVRVPHGDVTAPAYAMHVSDGVAVQRGGTSKDTSVPRFLPSTRLSLTLVPESRVEAVPPHSVFLRRDGGPLRVWNPSFEHAEGGALRLVGRADSLLPGAGAYLVVLVWGESVSPSEALALLEAQSDRVLSVALYYDDSPM